MLVKDIKSDLIRGWALTECTKARDNLDVDDDMYWSSTPQGFNFWHDVNLGWEEEQLREKYPEVFNDSIGSSEKSPEGTNKLHPCTFLTRKEDLKEFTKAALQGLCANLSAREATDEDVKALGMLAVEIATRAMTELEWAALAELDRRNQQPERNKS